MLLIAPILNGQCPLVLRGDTLSKRLLNALSYLGQTCCPIWVGSGSLKNKRDRKIMVVVQGDLPTPPKVACVVRKSVQGLSEATDIVLENLSRSFDGIFVNP